jgi:hypothetical protein
MNWTSWSLQSCGAFSFWTSSFCDLTLILSYFYPTWSDFSPQENWTWIFYENDLFFGHSPENA